MPAIPLGVIGAGWFAGMLTDVVNSGDQGEVVSCYARSPESRRRFAERQSCAAADSLDALLADPDIAGVLIATPHSTHEELIVAAAQAGKHVFVEKPLTLTMGGTRRAAAAAAAAGVVLQVGHNRRRQPANRRIKAMIQAGELGTVLQADAVHTSPKGLQPDLPAWRDDPAECPAGGMAALGVHMVDTFHYLLGPARRVMAMSAKRGAATGIDRATTVIIEYAAGPLATISTSFHAPVTTELSVHGQDAAVWNKHDGARLLVQGRAEKAPREVEVDVLDTVADEMTEFLICIRDGNAPETGAREGAEVAAVLDAIVASAEGGCAVVVEGFDDPL